MTSYLSPTLMVIGNDAGFRYLIQRYARESACRVVSVHLTEDILAAVLRESPGVVMLELDFADDRGRGMLRALKAHPATRDIPLIVCSWIDEDEWGLAEGAAIHIQKPILYDDFRAVMTHVAGWLQP